MVGTGRGDRVALPVYRFDDNANHTAECGSDGHGRDENASRNLRAIRDHD